MQITLHQSHEKLANFKILYITTTNVSKVRLDLLLNVALSKL